MMIKKIFFGLISFLCLFSIGFSLSGCKALHKHNWIENEVVHPTCTTEGTINYLCSKCKKTKTETVPALEHTEVIDEAIEPTCATIGLTEGKHCSVCHEILVKQEEIAMIEHNYIDEICSGCQHTKGLVLSLVSDGLSYEVIDYTGTSPKVVIPSTYQNLPVTSIRESAFYNCSSLTSITIGSNITSIGNGAFYNCSSLTNIIIPDSVTSVGEYAFSDCSNLTNIIIPDSVTSVGEYAFSDCSNLRYNEFDNALYLGNESNPYLVLVKANSTSITTCIINEKTKFIHSYAFSSCISLTSIIVPDGVTSIGSSAFRDCHSLTSIMIPDGVTSIGSSAFRECISLTSIVLPDSVISIGDIVFDYCISLASINVNPNNKVYDSRNNCNAIIETETNTLIAGCSNTVIPDSVTSIGSSAFRDCHSLTSIMIPDGVTSIGLYAFFDCNSLAKVYYEGTIEQWCNITFFTSDSNPMSYAKAFYMLNENKKYQEVTEIVIPEGITTIKDYAFYGFSNATSITIPNSVTSIGEYAFSYCYSLNYNESDNASYLGNESNPYLVLVEANSSITTCIINEKTKLINSHAFSSCSSLTSIIVPDSVTSIGEYAFSKCSSLTSITLGANITSIGNDAFYNCSNLTSITLGANVTSIGSSAFNGCNSLAKVYYEGTIEQWCNITFVGWGISHPMYYAKAFYMLDENKEYQEVTEIVLPEGITAIKDYTFYGFNNVTSITILGSVSSIGECAFYGCSNVTSITILGSVSSIGEYAFYGCSNLTNVYYTGTEEQWNAISIDSYNSDLTTATITYNYVKDKS